LSPSIVLGYLELLEHLRLLGFRLLHRFQGFLELLLPCGLVLLLLLQRSLRRLAGVIRGRLLELLFRSRHRRGGPADPPLPMLQQSRRTPAGIQRLLSLRQFRFRGQFGLAGLQIGSFLRLVHDGHRFGNSRLQRREHPRITSQKLFAPGCQRRRIRRRPGSGHSKDHRRHQSADE
jgi:hypothetical protein